jgi:hypothetical protein
MACSFVEVFVEVFRIVDINKKSAMTGTESAAL